MSGMARKQKWTVHQLLITKGGGIAVESGNTQLVGKVLRAYRCTPAAKVANRYFASAAMHNGAYAVANSGLPGDGLAHNVTCAQTAVDAEDTNGTLTIVGKDVNGEAISEVITPNDGATVSTLKAFKQVTSITGAGWTAGGGADTIVIGFGDLQGLPECVAAATDIILVAFDAAIVNAPTVTVSDTVVALNTVSAVGDATKVLKVIYQI